MTMRTGRILSIISAILFSSTGSSGSFRTQTVVLAAVPLSMEDAICDAFSVFPRTMRTFLPYL